MQILFYYPQAIFAFYLFTYELVSNDNTTYKFFLNAYTHPIIILVLLTQTSTNTRT